MAYSKKAEFTGQDIALAEMAKAISHPARIAIIKLLASRATCICGEIVDELPLSQSTVSQHLKALKAVGLIQGEIEGPKVCYCLDRAGVGRLSSLFDELNVKIEKSLNTKAKCC